jgi:peroxiredoxin
MHNRLRSIRHLLFSALALFFAPAFLASVQTMAQPLSQSLGNDLPNLVLTKLDGTRLATKDIKGQTLLIYFFPDCDHCQRETAQIRKHLKSFQKYALYFITSAPMPQISQFAQTYQLVGQPNIHFAQTSAGDIYRQVGAIPTPSVYIYSGDGHLKKSLKGETPIETILQAI